MIKKIKVEVAERKKSALREEYYELNDITNQVAMPIVNVDTLDDTLDTTNIVLYNKKSKPYNPFTKFIITIYEEMDYLGGYFPQQRIYRYVDTDTVERKTFGKKGIYCHTISLVEITKILEREPVQNLSFTNYLYSTDANASYELTVKGSGVYGFFSFNSAAYASKNRFPKYVQVGDSITNNVEMDVYCSTKFIFSYIPVSKMNYKVDYSKSYITLPSGKIVGFDFSSSYTFTETGKYKISQKYIQNEGFGNNNVVPASSLPCWWKYAVITCTWTINVVENLEDVDRVYNLAEVCNRLLACYKTRRDGVEEQKYILDSRLVEKLSLVESPEFNFTNSTLFEALSQIGNYVHAIPRLIPAHEERQKISLKYDYDLSSDIITNYGVATGGKILYNLKTNTYSVDPENPATEYGYCILGKPIFFENNKLYKIRANIDFDGFSDENIKNYNYLYVRPVAVDVIEAGSEIRFSTGQPMLKNDRWNCISSKSWVGDDTYCYLLVRCPSSILGMPDISDIEIMEVTDEDEATLHSSSYTSENGYVFDDNYYSNWNVISFDFLNEGDVYENDVFSLSEEKTSADNYTCGLVSEIQNGLQSVYNADATITEPFEEGYISVRTESGDLVINNDNFCLKTLFPIGAIKKVQIYNGSKNYDITQYVVEEAVYKTFKAYDSSSATESRFGYLYFKRGEKNIRGCDVQEETATWLESLFSSYPNSLAYALYKASGGTDFDLNPVNSYSYRIEYIPYINFVAKQMRYYVPEDMPEIYTFYNQSANSIDVEAMGENTMGVLARTSNSDYSETQYFQKYSDLPKIGDISKDKYYCFQVASEIMAGVPTKATICWSENYNKLSENVSYKKAIREYEVSENESFERFVQYDEYLIISDKFDLADYYTDASLANSSPFVWKGEDDDDGSVQTEIKNYLASNVIGNSTILTKPYIRIAFEKEGLTYTENGSQPITYAFLQTFEEGNDTPLASFILPVAKFAYGNSICFFVKLEDNYSAASTTTTQSSYRLEDYIPYGNDYGRCEKLSIAMGEDNPFTSKTNALANTHTLYNFDIDSYELYEDDFKFDFRSYPFLVEKDSREALSFMAQLHVCTDSKNVVLGRVATNIVPYQRVLETMPKLVIFHCIPRLFDEEIPEEAFEELEMDYATNADGDDGSDSLNTIAFYYSGSSLRECPSDCYGYGLLDENNKLICFINTPLSAGDEVPPIYLMFRRNV